MRRKLAAARCVAVLLSSMSYAAALPLASAATVQETPPLQFVKEYIRELGELERLRAAGEADLKQKDANVIGNGIHYSTRVQLALRADIAMLSDMHLDPQYQFVTADLIGMYKQKMEIHEQMIEILTEFMSGQQAGVDYGKLAAKMPQLRAGLESIDELNLQLSAVVFATLIDKKPDKDGHMSRLSITSAERQELLTQLQTAFGSKLNQKEQNNLVGAAEVLRSYLRKEKGYKCSDET